MSDPMKIGAAACEISPAAEDCALLTPTGMGRQVDTRGVLDPLRVEALCVEAGGELLFVLTSDLRTIEGQWCVEVRHRVAEATGCNERRIMFSAVHNHCSSPAVRRQDEACREALARANARIVDGFVNACRLAHENLAAAEFAASTCELSESIGLNRRMLMDNGCCINGWGAGPMIAPGRRILGPAGPDSLRVDILAARRVGETSPFAVLCSYPTHPHLYQLPYFSGEFPGAAKRAIEQRLPGVVAMHANATGGDLDLHGVHPMPEGDEAEVAWFRESADLLGNRFAEAVTAAIPTEGYESCDAVAFAEKTVDVAMVNAAGLGPVGLASMPGELFLCFGQRMLAESPFKHTLLLAYNGTTTGYVPPAVAFEQGSYEVMRGPRDAADTPGHHATETLGDEISDAVIELLNTVK